MTEAPASSSAERDPRVYFAAERTFLAWIRTGLALMGLGFAIARFGLFIRQLKISGLSEAPSFSGSTAAGITLIVLGVLVNILSTMAYSRRVRALNAGKWIPGRISRTAVVLAGALATLGILMAIRLFLIY